MPNKQRRPGRRDRSEAERTRQRILDRAERLFAEKGYRGVSMRALAHACGVRPFAIQHHFGSKLRLYQIVLCRWDEEVLQRMGQRLDGRRGLSETAGDSVDEVFEFLLSKRDWLRLNARAVLGEGLPRGVGLEDRSWVSFMEATFRARGSRPALDSRLLLITIDGILNNHVLATERYRHLFGKDVTDPALKARTKTHLKRVIGALLEIDGRSRTPPTRKKRRLPA